MVCEIVNKTLFPVSVKADGTETVLQPEERVSVSCEDGVLTAGLSMLMESFEEKCRIRDIFGRIARSARSDDMGFNIFERCAHLLDALFNGNLTREYRISLDSGYVYRDVEDGDRFLITFMEQVYQLGEYCRTPRLMKEKGGAPAEMRFFEKPRDAVALTFRNRRRSACLRNFWIIFICALLLCVVPVRYYVTYFLRHDVRNLELLAATVLSYIETVTYPAVAAVLSVINYRHCVKFDFITDFCDEESYF